MPNHHTINYVEFPVKNMSESKTFFANVFGWTFTDYGPDYCSISNAALDAGFYQSDQFMSASEGSALIVIYSESLNESKQRVEEFGGRITKPIFTFPGGSRFHFLDPGGNEFAVWSDK